MSAVPEEMPAGLSSLAACLTGRVVEHSARVEIRLGGENILACSPCESFQFVQNPESPDFLPKLTVAVGV